MLDTELIRKIFPNAFLIVNSPDKYQYNDFVYELAMAELKAVAQTLEDIAKLQQLIFPNGNAGTGVRQWQASSEASPKSCQCYICGSGQQVKQYYICGRCANTSQPGTASAVR